MHLHAQFTDRSTEWYAFRVRSRHEKRVASLLRGKGYDEFLPLSRSERRWSDRSVELELPLFPGYVFCDIERGDIARVRATAGIVDVVRAGALPLPASRPEIEQLRSAAASGLGMESCPEYVDSRLSGRVRIARGPLAGREGVVREHRGRERLVLSVDLLQRSVFVELDPSAVAPCSEAAALPN